MSLAKLLDSIHQQLDGKKGSGEGEDKWIAKGKRKFYMEGGTGEKEVIS